MKKKSKKVTMTLSVKEKANELLLKFPQMPLKAFIHTFTLSDTYRAHIPVALAIVNDERCGIERRSTSDEVPWRSLIGATPLILAAYLISTVDRVEMLRALLEAGAQMDARADNRFTALHFATYLQKVDVAELLINEGANVNDLGASGKTPLMMSAIENEGGAYLTQRLIDLGADLDAANDSTVLHLAVLFNRPVTQTLLGEGARTDIVDFEGNTPLHTLIIQGNGDVKNLRLLLQYTTKAELKIANKKGRTPLQEAQAKGHLSTIALLEEAQNKF